MLPVRLDVPLREALFLEFGLASVADGRVEVEHSESELSV